MLFKTLDKDHSGSLDEEEFVQVDAIGSSAMVRVPW